METTVNDTVSKETTDAKTREINAKAKLQATKDKVTTDKPLKNIVTGKAITVPTTKTAKVDKPMAMAKYQDVVILAGGTWEHLINTLKAEATKRQYKITINESYLRGHIQRRQIVNKEYLGDLTVTEKGVEKTTKKGKK